MPVSPIQASSSPQTQATPLSSNPPAKKVTQRPSSQTTTQHQKDVEFWHLVLSTCMRISLIGRWVLFLYIKLTKPLDSIAKLPIGSEFPKDQLPSYFSREMKRQYALTLKNQFTKKLDQFVKKAPPTDETLITLFHLSLPPLCEEIKECRQDCDIALKTALQKVVDKLLPASGLLIIEDPQHPTHPLSSCFVRALKLLAATKTRIRELVIRLPFPSGEERSHFLEAFSTKTGEKKPPFSQIKLVIETPNS